MRRGRWAWVGPLVAAWSASATAQEASATAAADVARVPETAYGADGFRGPAHEDWLLGSPFRLVPRPRGETPLRLPRGRPVEGGFAGRRLLLTFDDGPFPETTPRLLEILRREGVPAVFFLLAERVQETAQRRQGRRVARMIVQDGHTVGNHSFSHPDLTQLEPEQWKRQIVQAHDVLRSATGYAPTLFRPPYGSVNAEIDRYLRYRGYTRVQWTYVADESRGRSPEVMVRQILEQIRERERQGRKVGGVVLLHDAHARSVACAELLIRRIRAENCALLAAGDEDVWRFVAADAFFQPVGAPGETAAEEAPPATAREVKEARNWCAAHRDELDAIRALDQLPVDTNSQDFGHTPDGGSDEPATDDTPLP